LEAKALSTGFVVRAVELSDFAQWKALWAGYNAFYGRKDNTALPEEISQRTWDRFFDESEPIHALVADQAGQLLGIVHYIFHRSTITLGPVCYLQDLFTMESTRGKGVGRTLIEEVYRRARAARCDRVYWHTHETNAIARRLYDSVADMTGFVVYRKIVEG
jgi:GNAT superfamily N-acetyltransferase